MLKYTATLLALAFAGCIDSNPRTETPDKPSITGTSEHTSVAKEVMVSLSLSETHQVEFLKTEDGRYGVSEEGHLDKDGLEKSYLMHLQDDLRMADLYRHLAGSQANSMELEILSRADQEIERSELAMRADSAWNEEMEPASKRSAQVDLAALAEEIRSNAPALGKTSADCSQSNAFWSDDAKLQEKCFCDENSKHCKFNMVQTTSSWWRTRNFTSLGLTQDFCLSGLFTIDEEQKAPFLPCGTGAIAVQTITDNVVGPRKWRSITWTNNGGGGYCDNKFSYSARYKTSANGRGGLVVHPKPGFPDCSTLSPAEQACRDRGCNFTQGICACPI